LMIGGNRDWHGSLIKHRDTATNSLNGSANTVDVAEGLTIALDLQKHPVNDLGGQRMQMVLTLKMILVNHGWYIVKRCVHS
jgi:hypothetical protein